MKIETLLRAAQILRAQPGCTMPLLKLYARLTAELGPAAGSYAQLCRELKNRPHSFMLLDTPRLLGHADGWPRHVREAYEEALDGAGLGACVRVALTELPLQSNDTLSLAHRTMGELWPAAAQDATLLALLRQGSEQLNEISSLLAQGAEAEHPTTPPRDPPP